MGEADGGVRDKGQWLRTGARMTADLEDGGRGVAAWLMEVEVDGDGE